MRRIKKGLVSLVLVLAVMVSICTTSMAAANRIAYVDVPTSAWYYSAVDKVTNDYGLMSGYGENLFGPTDALTREQFVQILFNMSRLDKSNYYGRDIHNTFSDAENGIWYAPAVAWAIENNVTSGTGNGKFGIGQTVTREQIAVFMYNYCQQNAIAPQLNTSASSFGDAASVSSWAANDVAWCHQAGIFAGDDKGNFNPAKGTSRAEAAQVIVNFYANVYDTFELSKIPAYSGSPYVQVNGNVPFFSASEYTTTSFEFYSDLDNLGRCGVAYACVGQDLMPTEDRGSIGQIQPSGWHTVRYDGVVDGNYLYNRCHLIGYQLTGENANKKNLITGTRYLNMDGMLPFENMVADYVKETGNHVLYRVTPIFDGNNLVASGVLIEAMSMEDGGEAIRFNVFCYNVQPGVTVDYTTGDSYLSGAESSGEAATQTYILNTSSKKFHNTDCSSVSTMSEKNKSEYTGTRDELISWGYTACGICNP